ncbi:MAG: hypothetical protein IPM29_12170 [Planctomycetes bacterium]|nr:hypothetical protein [Planctomycetota bacterium]
MGSGPPISALRLGRCARLAVCASVLAAPTALAQIDTEAAHPEPRAVLALSAHHRDDGRELASDFVERFLAMPLEHLGLDLHCRSYPAGEPADLDPDQWRGALVLVDAGATPPDWLAGWLARQARRVHVVLLGDLTSLRVADPASVDDLLRTAGLEWRDGFTDDPFRIEVGFGDPGRTCFEAPPVRLRSHQGPALVDPRLDAWVSTRDRRRPDDVRHPVVTGRFGGLALDPWLLDPGDADGGARWHVDPFRFFAAAFRLDGLPVPDPCVRHGRRRFFFRVDGDGFESLSTVEHGQLAAEVMRDHVVDGLRVPVTLGVNVASLAETIDPSEPTRAMRVARELFARSQVEAASNGVLRTLDWRAGTVAGERPRGDVWRASLGGYHHDPRAEVRESIRFVDRFLAPPDRPCRLVLWSGLANPDAATLAEVDRLGAIALNGGDSRCDAADPTLTAVPPHARRIGGDALQVFAAGPSEAYFAGFYDDLPGAFAHVDQTLRRTGAPRILKPVDVHARFESAERPARLRALVTLLETWALTEETCVGRASDWVRAVRGSLLDCTVARVPDGFLLRGFDACTTARIEGPTPPIDWARSTGIAGARRLGDALYVDVCGDPARLVFDRVDRPAPHLEQANCPCTEIVRSPTGVAWTSSAVEGFERRAVLAGFAPGAALSVRIGPVTRTAAAGADGRCVVACSGGGDLAIGVEVAR